jgi:hypothetical protein
MVWFLEKINTGDLTVGAAAPGDPFASVFLDKQWHVVCRAGDGNIWDAFYDATPGAWNLQKLNVDGRTVGPAAVGDPCACVFLNTWWNVVYRDGNGTIWNAFYDATSGNWGLGKINAGGSTTAPAAAGDPCASVFMDKQWHVVYRAANGDIWDAFYDATLGSWAQQKINAGGLTNGPAAAGDPCVSVFSAKQLTVGAQVLMDKRWQVVYRANNGDIWNASFVVPPEIELQVSANQCFHSINGEPARFTLPPGLTATFTASGTWLTHSNGPGTPWYGVGGNGVPNQGTYYCGGCEGCMVIFYAAQVAPPAVPNITVWDWFKSDDQSFTTNTPGTYYFAANDDYYNNGAAYNDNQGIISLHVVFAEPI